MFLVRPRKQTKQPHSCLIHQNQHNFSELINHQGCLKYTMSGLLRRSFGAVQDTITKAMYGTEKGPIAASLYECVDKRIDGSDVNMSDYQGKVLLVVNVASK